MDNIKDKVVLITGVGKGSGRVPAERSGFGVIINLLTETVRDERNEAAFTSQAALELNPYGIQVHAVKNLRDKIVEEVFALLGSHTEEQ